MDGVVTRCLKLSNDPRCGVRCEVKGYWLDVPSRFFSTRSTFSQHPGRQLGLANKKRESLAFLNPSDRAGKSDPTQYGYFF